ncbi:hypothetical protein A9320_06605 [Ruegeria sp. PBVC088]|nr:hypothetical protein A9320_06605 [Ruegeria sp. PBVC088]
MQLQELCVPEATSSPSTIEAWLSKSAHGQDWCVVNVRLRHHDHSQRLLLDDPRPLADVFAPELARILDAELAAIKDTAVNSRSGFKLELRQLTLHGLRILTRIDPTGSGTASVRFVRAEGDLCHVLGPGLRCEHETPPNIDDIALPVLCDLLYPALEIFDHILENGLTEADSRVLAARIKTMRAKRDELSDYIGLLSRFIESAPQRRAAIGQQQRPLSLSSPGTIPSRDIRWDSSGRSVRGEHGAILHGHHDAPKG